MSSEQKSKLPADPFSQFQKGEEVLIGYYDDGHPAWEEAAKKVKGYPEGAFPKGIPPLSKGVHAVFLERDLSGDPSSCEVKVQLLDPHVYMYDFPISIPIGYVKKIDAT